MPVDVLAYEEKSLCAILRVISSGLVKLWSALTLQGSYQNRRCAFRVLQVMGPPPHHCCAVCCSDLSSLSNSQ